VLRIFGDIQIEFPIWLILSAGFAAAFFITYIVIPSIVKVSNLKGLFDRPNDRTSHTGNIPTLGGVAVFIGWILTFTIFSGSGIDHELKYIIGAMLILFFIGIKDDVLMIDPKKKLISQILAAGIVGMLGDIRITCFHNFLGICDIPYFVSILVTIFVAVVIINGFNLIDGIDGLASGVGIIASAFFGTWFFINHYTSYSIMSFALTGSLLSFFFFNVYGKENKIFLGDTGSLIIGLAITVFTIRFLEYDLNVSAKTKIDSGPAVAIGVLIVPLFDTLRVFFIRIMQRGSPFKADRQHIHHQLLDLTNSHIQSTIIILVANLFIIALCLLLQSIGIGLLLLVVVVAASILSYIPNYLVSRRKSLQ
jgi:UDP-N-acetylmuramyl pentapeptide phosphotransferase/UDP-N-acetylglucosamine-1-phosphate transferase